MMVQCNTLCSFRQCIRSSKILTTATTGDALLIQPYDQILAAKKSPDNQLKHRKVPKQINIAYVKQYCKVGLL